MGCWQGVSIIPREIRNGSYFRVSGMCQSVAQILNETGFFRLTRLTSEEIIGTPESAGIIENYFFPSQENTTCLEDITLGGAGAMKVEINISTFIPFPMWRPPCSGRHGHPYDKYSTDKCDCRLSFAAPVGILLTVITSIINMSLLMIRRDPAPVWEVRPEYAFSFTVQPE